MAHYLYTRPSTLQSFALSRVPIDFLFFDAGGGHRAAATALKAAIEQCGLPWDVDLINLQDVMDPIDVFHKITRIRAQDVYNLFLRKGWTGGSRYILPMIQGVIRLYHPQQVHVLRDFYARRSPRLIVSLIPNFNRAVFQAISVVQPGVPYVTILTDMADFPPHFWIENQPQSFICGTEHAAQQARLAGHPDPNIALTSGMILRPSFYEPIAIDRDAERQRLGLDPATPTGLLLFGGHGSTTMATIIKVLDKLERPVQLIAICGRNEKLARQLRSLPSKHKVHVEGFTSDIPRFMYLSDFFIGKPGPGSISEALRMELPVIVELNWKTMPQERFNAQWVEEKQLGIVLESFMRIDRAVDQLLQPGVLATYRDRARRIDNRAVFEIPQLLQRLLDGQPVNPQAAR